MTWVKLDANIFRHPKILSAGRDARDLYIAGLCYCGENLTDGHIPDTVIRVIGFDADIGDPKSAADTLVGVGLWERNGTGYVVHDYLEWQRGKEATKEISEKRAEAGRKGGVKSGEARAKQIASGLVEAKRSKTEADKIRVEGTLPSSESESTAYSTRARRGSKPVSPIPPDFSLTDDMMEFGTSRGLSRGHVTTSFEAFVSHAIANDRRQADWPATWRTWVLKDVAKMSAATNGRADAGPRGDRSPFADKSTNPETWMAYQREVANLRGEALDEADLRWRAEQFFANGRVMAR